MGLKMITAAASVAVLNVVSKVHDGNKNLDALSNLGEHLVPKTKDFSEASGNQGGRSVTMLVTLGGNRFEFWIDPAPAE